MLLKSKGRTFDTGQHNVSNDRINSRKYIRRVYSLIAVLILTLGLIGILEYANRTLPGASQGGFNPLNTGTSSQIQSAIKTSSGQSTRLITTTADFEKRQLPSGNATTSTSASTSPTSTTDSNTVPPTANFVAATVSSTISSAACTATAAPQLCTCPVNSAVSDCRCQVDTNVGVCACTFAVDNSTGLEYQSCVCPPDTCTVCECPAVGSSHLTSCMCPSDPDAAGCSCFYETSSDPSCPSIRQCNCGIAVIESQCTIIPAVSTVQQNTTTTQPSTTPIISPAPLNSTSSSPFPSVSPLIVTTRNGTVSVVLVPVATTPLPSISPISAAAPLISPSKSPSLQIAPVAAIPATTLSKTQSLPNGAAAAAAAAISASPLSNTPTLQNTPVVIISASSSTNPQGAVVVVPVTVGTTTLRVPANQPPPTIVVSVGTNSLGVSQTFSTTEFPAPVVPTNVVFFVSNVPTTNAAGSPILTPVTFLQVPADPSVTVVTGSTGQILTVPALLFSESPTPIPSLTPTGSGSGSGSGGGGGGGGGAGDSGSTEPVKVAVYYWPKAKTFLGGYVPILIAKGYQIAWSAFLTGAKDAALVNLLTSPNGASGAQLFNHMDHSSWILSIPYISSWIVVPFAAESLVFNTNYGCDNPDPNNPTNPCWPPKISANTWVIRLIQSFLSVNVAIAVILLAFWFKKPRGGSIDPTSIAAITAIAGHPEVVQDFSVPAETTSKQLKKALKDKKYTLGEYQTGAGVTRYGLIPLPKQDGNPNGSGSQEETLEAKSSFSISALSRDWKNKATYIDVLFLTYCLLLLALVTAYLSYIDKTTLSRILHGNGTGYRILFTLIAAIACIHLRRVERDMQTLTPYMQLQALNALPARTILLRKHTLALTSFLPMLRNRHFTAAAVAFAAILSEFLVITLSGLPYRPGQLRSEFFFCGSASIAILMALVVVLLVVNVWRRYLPPLPRKPGSVAAVMTYVCQSAMVGDFEGLERVSVEERDAKIKQLGKVYGYGLKVNEEKGRRWAVDEI